jgi:hypothetical protein
VDATIQDILGLGLPDFLDTHAVPDYQLKAALNLLRCRTAALGGHIEECPEGHTQHVWYNSCRHRSCPQCAFLQIEQWLEKKKELILPCDHYHFIFTQPSELRRLWQYNLEPMADLLFHSSSATLTKLLGDEAHLGARPGILAALHTWGRTLVFHPHLHCLVTGGGLTPDGEWKAVRNGFLLPARVVREVYRGKFLEGLEKLLRGGQLQLPPELTLDSALQLLAPAGAQEVERAHPGALRARLGRGHLPGALHARRPDQKLPHRRLRSPQRHLPLWQSPRARCFGPADAEVDDVVDGGVSESSVVARAAAGPARGSFLWSLQPYRQGGLGALPVATASCFAAAAEPPGPACAAA